MDDEHQLGAEFHSESTVDRQTHPDEKFTGAFFTHAEHLAFSGGRFTSITNITPGASVPSDFRRIPMGDLDLRSEKRQDCYSAVVPRSHGRCSVRRMYSARIFGSKSSMTVALYQGENAEEEWRQDISRHASLRHPNIMQLFGTASSSSIHAAIFYDDLIPAIQTLNNYRGSHFSAVYAWCCLDVQFADAHQYVNSVLGTAPFSWACMIWIRPSTGRLCVDLTPGEYDPIYLYPSLADSLSRSLTTASAFKPPEDSKIIDSISLDDYHAICFAHFSTHGSQSIDEPLYSGELIHWSDGSDVDHLAEIGFIPELKVSDSGWSVTGPVVIESGWTRVNSNDIDATGSSIHRVIHNLDGDLWLAQANHIFDRLRITSNLCDYGFVDLITYRLTLSNRGGSIPPGYLFLCPFADMQSDSPSRFRRPQRPAYWSLDPAGVEPLSMEQVEQLGFPFLELKMEISVFRWDDSVYTGIRRFHQAKGFAPGSQEVARELGCPLFEVLTEFNGPFAHVEDPAEDSEHNECRKCSNESRAPSQ